MRNENHVDETAYENNVQLWCNDIQKNTEILDSTVAKELEAAFIGKASSFDTESAALAFAAVNLVHAYAKLVPALADKIRELESQVETLKSQKNG